MVHFVTRFLKRLKIERKPIRVYRFYREWPACHGWGVMLYTDSVWAKDVDHARSFYCRARYAEGWITTCCVVKDEHLHMTNEELMKHYGEQD